MTSILERLTRIESHLGIGKAEQPPTKERTFEAFYVDCTRDEYPEVRRILEAQGYELYGDEWKQGEDCVTTTTDGCYMTYAMSDNVDYDPTYTLLQLREKFGVSEQVSELLKTNEWRLPTTQEIDVLEQPQPQEKLRDFVVPLAHATLTREEVAARCVAAAEKKGYRNANIEDFKQWEKNSPPPVYLNFFNDSGFGYSSHDIQKSHPNTLATLEAFEEYCGVEPPAQPIYEAGFWFSKTHDIVLNLPDKSMIWMAYTGWAKANRGGCEPHPHTLTPVATYTVGKFYALAGASGAHLNDYRNYALCVAVGDTTMFVRASTEYGVVLVERARERDVTLNEVTPV